MNSKCCNAEIHKDQYGHKRCSHCLLVSESKLSFRIIIILLLMSIIIMGFSIKTSDGKYTTYATTTEASVDTCDVELSDSCLLKELIKDSVILPGVALAQAKIESDYYRSYKCVHCKNLFGIKPHKCDLVKGEYLYQATYASYKDCIKCYSHIQRFYLKSIDGHYAQNPAYVNLIKQMK